MCGIVSIILKDPKKVLSQEQITMFKQMLYADALRGWDSTGIASIKASGYVGVIKDTGSPSNLFSKNHEAMWAFNSLAFIGHNRSSTRGASNKENAHPFTEKHITLVHNGTLNYHHHLKPVDVDSHAITHGIADKGDVETLEKLHGSYALVWYNAETKQINAARNEQRPLYLIDTPETFILASEVKLVEWICDRNYVPIKRTQALTPGLIYTFKEGKKGIFTATKRFTILKPPPVIKEEENDFPNSKVTTIQPYKSKEVKENLDIKTNDIVEVLMHKRSNVNYSAFGLGNFRWTAESMEYPELFIEIFTNDPTDYSDHLVNVKVFKQYYSYSMNQEILIGCEPSVQKKQTQTPPALCEPEMELNLLTKLLKPVKTYSAKVAALISR